MATSPSPLDVLFNHPEVRPNPGASDAFIDAVEGRLGLTLPEPVRELYRRSDGARVGSIFDFIPVADAGPFAETLNQGSSPFGLFPLTEADDSNPVCVVCRGPLTGHVVHVFHDDQPRLLFRSFDDFAAAVPALLAADDWLEDMPTPFDGPDRTAADRRVAGELLAFAGTLDPADETVPVACRFAVTLLGAGDVPEIARLLDHPSEYVRRTVVQRLTQLGTTAATEAVGAYRRRFDEFARRVVAELRAAGLEAELTRDRMGPGVRVGRRPVHLNLDSFYRFRDQPDGFARIVRRVRELLDLDQNR